MLEWEERDETLEDRKGECFQIRKKRNNCQTVVMNLKNTDKKRNMS